MDKYLKSVHCSQRQVLVVEIQIVALVKVEGVPRCLEFVTPYKMARYVSTPRTSDRKQSADSGVTGGSLRDRRESSFL